MAIKKWLNSLYSLKLSVVLLNTLFCLSLTTLFCLQLIYADFKAKSSGSSGAAFLKIGAGARPTAMGEAYTGVADDINSIYWNTAGLGNIKKNEFIAMRAQLFQGLEYNFFGFAHPTKKLGTFGIGLNSLNVSDIEQRSADTDKPDTTFSSNDSAYTLAYAYRVPVETIGGINVGVGMKYIHQKLGGDRANGFATDIGSHYQFEELPLGIGLAVQNIGTKIKFKNEGDNLPLAIKAGASYRLGVRSNKGMDENGVGMRSGLLMALDLHMPRDNDPSVRLGSEFTRLWGDGQVGTSIRGAGYQVGRGGQSQLGSTGFGVSAGVGVSWRFFSFDFAWMPFKDLGDTYRYSIKLRF